MAQLTGLGKVLHMKPWPGPVSDIHSHAKYQNILILSHSFILLKELDPSWRKASANTHEPLYHSEIPHQYFPSTFPPRSLHSQQAPVNGEKSTRRGLLLQRLKVPHIGAREPAGLHTTLKSGHKARRVHNTGLFICRVSQGCWGLQGGLTCSLLECL